MAGQVIRPDLDFVKDVIASGGESLKKCYQCATCSVVCNITPDNKPFPRKEMIWAQWGLKEKFLGNPDVWLCHQCNDCTAYCPRGANPGEVLGAIRKQSIRQYSAPNVLSGFVSNRKSMVLLFLLPAILLLAVGGFGIPDGEIKFSNFFSVHNIQFVFTPALLFGLAVSIMGIRKFWADMKKAGGVTTGDLKGSIIETAKEILSHNKFKDCGVSRDRFSAHFLVFYSFIALGIATGFGVLYIDILGVESPFSFGHGTPVKLFGIIGAIGLLAGVLLMIKNRFKNAEKVGIGSYFDWQLITIIGVIMASGILAWLTRLAGVAILAYPIYFIHLVVVFSLFLYLPYSKLAHMFYRATAICFVKYSERE
ncbi:MAG: quinone-interacting membrane-bound oxidoreductase complex subunit QmoC [Candidatus Scalindua sp.]